MVKTLGNVTFVHDMVGHYCHRGKKGLAGLKKSMSGDKIYLLDL
jgi:hypothetical protein